MEELEEISDPIFLGGFSPDNPCVENRDLARAALGLLDLTTPSLATLGTGNEYTNSTITSLDNSSVDNIFDLANAKMDDATRQRELNRLRQRRYRERKSKWWVNAAKLQEHTRNEIEKEEEENKRLIRENWAMTSLVDNASSLLQKMKLSSASSLSRILRGPYRKILKILTIAASAKTIEYVNDELPETLYAFGPLTIIRAASLFLGKDQFRDIIHMPLTLVCRLMVEWCDHPEKRPALEKRLEVRFHRTVTYFKAIREVWPDIMESAICPAEDFRRKVKEQYLDRLNHVDLVQTTRLSEEQKRKLLLAWREYRRRFCGLNALVTQSIKLLEVDCGGASYSGDNITTISTEETALASQALESLHSFQTSEREAYFDMIETTFIMTPLQWFRLRLLGLCSLENSLLGIYLAVLQMM